jgi:polar amino acid transport system substrate-binding protein
MKFLGKIVLAASALALLSGYAFAGGQKQSGGLTIEPGVLRVGAEITYPPFEYKDPNDGITPIGFDVDMGKALAEKLGLKYNIIDTAWDGIFAGVDKGDYDVVISGVTWTEARSLAHNFTKPYIGNAQSIVVLKSSPMADVIKSPADLDGRSVAYQEETTSDIFTQTLINDQGLKIQCFEYPSIQNAMSELELDRADAVMSDSTVASDYVKSPDSKFKVVWLGPADEVFCICLKKGNDALTDALDKAMDELFADGTMKILSM